MAIRQTTRGKITHVTSTYFDDLRMIKKSEVETDYRDLHRNSNFDIAALKQSYAVQKLILFKKGCQELSEWAIQLPKDRCENITTDYMGEDYEEYTGNLTIEEMLKKE